MLSVGKCNAYGMTGEINNRRYGWGEWMSEYTYVDTGMNDRFFGRLSSNEWRMGLPTFMSVQVCDYWLAEQLTNVSYTRLAEMAEEKSGTLASSGWWTIFLFYK